MRRVEPTETGIAEAARCLHGGDIVAYPTETVYGLGVDPFNEDALVSLFNAKGRGEQHPVLLVVAGQDQLKGVVACVSDNARRCIEQFWPGPLSLLFPKSARLPGLVTGGSPKVCVRQTADPVAQALCRAFGSAIVSTSANPSGAAPASSLDDVRLEAITLGIDAGALPPSAPSTVLDPDTGALYREGAIERAAIEQVVRIE